MGSGTLISLILALIVLAVLVYGVSIIMKNQPKGASASTDSDQRKAEPISNSAAPIGPDQELAQLGAGDVVAFWSGKEVVVERVLDCQETLPSRVTRWRWAFVDEPGRESQLLALTPSGNTLYTDTKVFNQGSAEYETLTADIEAGGVLKTFEARVREGAVGRNPVYFDIDGQRYNMISTGTFGVADQPVPERPVWSDVSAKEGDNVYFRLAGPEETQVLGIWTSHIALLIGKPLPATDVREIYRASTPRGTR